ncbi:MAG: rRNA maturation RNase YbeY [Thermoleophilaceae bacterium]|nr:rRNA maturation RNase YbeY [Thermoleophilaceae bacterium]
MNANVVVAMREVEVIGAPDESSVLRAANATLDRLCVVDAHVAIEFVDEAQMQALNLQFRELDKPTDVLSFPIDGESIAAAHAANAGETHGEAETLELGDVVICAQHTTDIPEAVVHGVLHLCGFDHEKDSGQMLTLQDSIVDSLVTA